MKQIARIVRSLRLPVFSLLVDLWVRNKQAFALLREHGLAAFPEAFRELAADYRTIAKAGGLTIQTPDGAARDSNPIKARLLLQPDGDVVHCVTDEFLDDPEAQCEHQARVDSFMADSQRRIGLVATGLTLATSPVFLLIGLITMGWTALNPSWWVAVLGALFAILVPAGITRLLKSWLRKALT